MSVETRPPVMTSLREARAFVRQSQADGKRVGVVMTMGALHPGHLSLIDACRQQCDVCVTTIFVNPTQFGPNEDYEKYPRNLDADLALMTGHQVDLVFAPERDQMYRPEHSTVITAPEVAMRLEGAHRDRHFAGVCTIVLKLLHAIPADDAFFGQKDYQQCAVIKNMVADLNVATEIVICPTIRGEDGLAMSSRNQYLSPEERTRATSIHRALRQAASKVADGEDDANVLRMEIEQTVSQHVDNIDYVAIVDTESLLPVDKIQSQAVALIACHVGKTRLIDNWILQRDS